MKARPPIFFKNYNFHNNEIRTEDSYIFRSSRLFVNEISVMSNTLLPTLSKTLYTSVVRFRDSTSEHITKTLFQFVFVCKTAPT
jgi:hypothetical protein